MVKLTEKEKAGRQKTAEKRMMDNFAKQIDPRWRRIVAEEYCVASRRAEQRYRELQKSEVSNHAAA